MPRPIWTGTLSFGLLHVPVSVMTGERREGLGLRMLDGRDRNPVRYQRVNAETGEEVPWDEVVKAYEVEKGRFVVIEPEDLEAAAPERHESIDVESFVDREAIGARFYDKPYVLTPGKKAEKGYVLLRETLAHTGKVGVARVVIRTREHLAALFPERDALVMMLLRFPETLVDPEDFALPRGDLDRYRITDKELEMASELIESMATEWEPSRYRDDYRERLAEIVEARLHEEGATARVESPARPRGDAATNVVDFMALLEKSLESTRPARAKRSGAKKPAARKSRGPAKTRPKKPAKKKTG